MTLRISKLLKGWGIRLSARSPFARLYWRLEKNFSLILYPDQSYYLWVDVPGMAQALHLRNVNYSGKHLNRLYKLPDKPRLKAGSRFLLEFGEAGGKPVVRRGRKVTDPVPPERFIKGNRKYWVAGLPKREKMNRQPDETIQETIPVCF